MPDPSISDQLIRPRKTNALWLLQMALRDSRRNRMRLLLFMTSIVLGIAALVAINAFGRNLEQQIDAEARGLLGADIELESRQPFADSVMRYIDSLGFQQAEEVSFASMVRFPRSGGTRLVNVRAISKGFPFYGEMLTIPTAAAQNFVADNAAVVENTLLVQYGAVVGDSIQVGEIRLPVTGAVEKVPGQSGIASTVAPPVFIPLSLLPQTQLLQQGSRLNYRLYLKFPASLTQAQYEASIKPRLEALDVRFTDVEERKEDVGEAYKDLAAFLNLIAFVALLLGCIGVGSSIHIYIREKKQSVALLRCLGAKGSDGMLIYLFQIMMLAFIGATVGALLGTAIQYLLPGLFADFLPVDIIPRPSGIAILQGIALGLVAALLFALPPLISIQQVSPLMVLRAEAAGTGRRWQQWLVYALMPVFVFLFAWWQMGKPWNALVFTGAILLAFLLLALVAQLIIWMVRRFMPAGAPFTLRQALANLYRPNNQTLILVSTIGLGTALITTLLLSQDLLINKVKFSASPKARPNMVVFDIQDQQVDTVVQITRQFGLPNMGVVPIVSMKMQAINGRTIEDLKEDSTITIRRGWLEREYRVTYRDSLIDSETLLEGEWKGRVQQPGDSIFISLDRRMAQDLKLGLGDAITWNVQGAPMDTYVGSIRKVDFQRVQTNFLVLFPAGVLEEAPKFHVLLSRFDSVQQSARYQNAVVRQYPNVSIIDLNLILQTIDEVLGKVSFVIRFMAFFSILTGMVVLMGSVRLSKRQRMQESVLLRTMGASRRQIITINTLEYFILGSLAALTGILIAVAFSAALATFSFETVLAPAPLPLLLAYTGITGITVLIGLFNSRDVVNRPPLEILRAEG